jgi:hypothetical protein
MPVPFHRFVAGQALGIAALNCAMNAGYTWALWRPDDALPLFGEGGVAFDLASTPVWIAVLSTLLGSAAVRRQLRSGQVTPPAASAPSILAGLPTSIALRAVALGAVAAISLMLPIWLLFQASGLETLSLQAAVLTKVALTAPLTVLIVPLVILAALADVQRGRGVTRRAVA